ncbi:MAG: hypothetical protein N2109_11545 [Fimbriimonadales bacterium]|nr:hypothetical protein [Fimbriimonadales bacterium]
MELCGRCTTPMDGSFGFCPLCGEDLRTPDERWPVPRSCSHRVVGGPFCPDCGADVSHRLEAWRSRRALASRWGAWVCAAGWCGFAAALAWSLAPSGSASQADRACAALALLSLGCAGWAWRRDWWRWSPPGSTR